MEKILHFHIPKTGGLALQHYFVEHLGKARVSDTILGSRLKDAVVQFDYLDVVSGHFSLQQGDRLPRDRCCITVLRNPLDRFLSEYFYNRSDSSHRLLGANQHALNLDVYLEQLSSNQQEDMAVQIGMLYALGTSSRTYISMEEKFAAAIKAIDSFDLIGTQEELVDFACMLDARFGWEGVPLKLKNATSQRISVESLSPQHAHKLRTFFAQELELYQYAKSRFQASRREFIRRSTGVVSHESLEMAQSNSTDEPANESSTEFGDRRCVIEEVSVTGEISGASIVMIGEYFNISLKIKALEPVGELNASIGIKDDRGLLIFGTNSMRLGHAYSLKSGDYVMHFKILNRMPKGSYHVDAALIKGESHYAGCHHWRENVASFMVYDSVMTPFEGHVFMDADVSITSGDESACEHKSYMAAVNQVRSFGRVNAQLRQFTSSITPLSQLENLLPGMDICVPMQLPQLCPDGL